jgi:hypothetical protein
MRAGYSRLMPAGPLLKSAPAGIFESGLWISFRLVSSAALTVASATPRAVWVCRM